MDKAIVVISIYLSGPITGRSQDLACLWRQDAKNMLDNGFNIIDPTRQEIDTNEYFEGDYSDSILLKRERLGRLIVKRNKSDVRRSSLLIANFLGAQTRASIGTVGEIHWAECFNVPVVIVREPKGNIHDHAMLNAIAMHTADDLKSACCFVNEIFGRA